MDGRSSQNPIPSGARKRQECPKRLPRGCAGAKSGRSPSARGWLGAERILELMVKSSSEGLRRRSSSAFSQQHSLVVNEDGASALPGLVFAAIFHHLAEFLAAQAPKAIQEKDEGHDQAN